MKSATLFLVRFRVAAALLAALLLAPAAGLNAEDEVKSDAPQPVKIAQISIAGPLHDALAADNPFSGKSMNFKQLLDLIEQAMNDSEIQALLLQVDSPEIGFAKTRELRRVLQEFKDSGKKILAFTESISLKDLAILSICDFLAAPESAMIVIPGFNLEVMYYKGLFEKIGFRMLVEHIGDYKSAYENFHLDGMSAENRKVLNILLDEFYATAVSLIAEGRGIPGDKVAEAIDRAILTPQEAQELGLIDGVMYRDQFDEHVKTSLGAQSVDVVKKYGRDSLDLDTDNPLVLFRQLMAVFSPKKKEKSDKPKIALIYATGPIASGKNSMDPFSQEPTIGSDTMAKAIKDAADDDTVKAIVLRVDSPGGSGLASDIIWRAECLAKEKKPLVVSMGDVAGSGGYYISMAADKILAEPGTITGSIGVVSAVPNIHGTLEKLGIKVERIARGRNAQMMSLMAPPEEVNLALFGEYMEKFYWDFVDKVAAGRGLTRDAVHALAQGRVWTGRQAVENGLVDAIGSLDDAIEVARIKAGLSEDSGWEIVESPEPPDFFSLLKGGDDEARARLLSALGIEDGADRLLLSSFPEMRRILGDLFTFIKAAREDRFLYMMPIDIRVN